VKQVIDRLVVGVMYIPQSWSKEVNQMNISCVLCNIPNDVNPCREGKRTSASATSGNSFHKNVEDPIPFLITQSLDLRLVRVNEDSKLALIQLKGPEWQTERGEWMGAKQKLFSRKMPSPTRQTRLAQTLLQTKLPKFAKTT
jgi:hypothetical protein